MKAMQIFEPAMCCPTGLCGVGVDSELMRVSTALEALRKHGVTVDRFNLNSAPMEFVRNQTVNGFINEKGAEGLPVVLLDGEIILSGRYPHNGEFTQWLGLSPEVLGPPVIKDSQKKSGGCDCKGGCC